MKHFSYKGGCGMMQIGAFKKELAWDTGKQLQLISTTMLFKQLYH